MESPRISADLVPRRDLVRTLALVGVVVLFLRAIVASPYWVPTSSMEPTIKVGDRLLGFKLAYGLRLPFMGGPLLTWSSPARGEIVIFRDPRSPDIDIVKRVVGLGGDEISIVDDVLTVNGKRQPLKAIRDRGEVLSDIDDASEEKDLFEEVIGASPHWVMMNIPSKRVFGQRDWPAGGFPFKVPAGTIFVMGDNRDTSADSRVWGEVPLTYVRGRAVLVLWSMYTPRGSDWPTLRWTRFLNGLR